MCTDVHITNRRRSHVLITGPDRGLITGPDHELNASVSRQTGAKTFRAALLARHMNFKRSECIFGFPVTNCTLAWNHSKAYQSLKLRKGRRQFNTSPWKGKRGRKTTRKSGGIGNWNDCNLAVTGVQEKRWNSHVKWPKIQKTGIVMVVAESHSYLLW